MNAKTYLMQIKELDNKIQAKRLEIESLYGLVESATIKPKKVNVQSSIPEDRFGDIMAEAIDLKHEYESELEEFLKIKFQAIKLINKLDDVILKSILIRRYVKYETWGTIANEMGYTRQGIKKKEQRALIEFEKVYTSLLDLP